MRLPDVKYVVPVATDRTVAASTTQRVDQMRRSASRQPALDPSHTQVSAVRAHKSPLVLERPLSVDCHSPHFRCRRSANSEDRRLFAALIFEFRPVPSAPCIDLRWEQRVVHAGSPGGSEHGVEPIRRSRFILNAFLSGTNPLCFAYPEIGLKIVVGSPPWLRFCSSLERPRERMIKVARHLVWAGRMSSSRLVVPSACIS